MLSEEELESLESFGRNWAANAPQQQRPPQRQPLDRDASWVDSFNEHWANYQPEPPKPPVDRSYSSAFAQGVDQPLEAIGDTANVFGATGVGKFLKGLTDAPKNYESAGERFMNPQEGDFTIGGFAPAYMPRALVEQAGQLIGSLGTRAAGAAVGGAIGGALGAPAGGVGAVPGAVTGGVVGGFAGPFLFGALQVAGPTAMERAKANGRETPDWDDISWGLATAAASGSLDALSFNLPGGKTAIASVLGKFAPKAAAMLETMAKKPVQNALVDIGGEAFAEGSQGLIEQLGASAGTDKGAEVNWKQVVGEGLLGGGFGAVNSALEMAKESLLKRDEVVREVADNARAEGAEQTAAELEKIQQQAAESRRRAEEMLAAEEAVNEPPDLRAGATDVFSPAAPAGAAAPTDPQPNEQNNQTPVSGQSPVRPTVPEQQVPLVPEQPAAQAPQADAPIAAPQAEPLDPNILATLATHPDAGMRLAVAWDVNTPKVVLDSLLQDPDPRVREVAEATLSKQTLRQQNNPFRPQKEASRFPGADDALQQPETLALPAPEPQRAFDFFNAVGRRNAAPATTAPDNQAEPLENPGQESFGFFGEKGYTNPQSTFDFLDAIGKRNAGPAAVEPDSQAAPFDDPNQKAFKFFDGQGYTNPPPAKPKKGKQTEEARAQAIEAIKSRVLDTGMLPPQAEVNKATKSNQNLGLAAFYAQAFPAEAPQPGEVWISGDEFKQKKGGRSGKQTRWVDGTKLPQVSNPETKQTRNLFTNNPHTTAMQLDMGLAVNVPEGVTPHPRIQMDGERKVVAVDHPVYGFLSMPGEMTEARGRDSKVAENQEAQTKGADFAVRGQGAERELADLNVRAESVLNEFPQTRVEFNKALLSGVNFIQSARALASVPEDLREKIRQGALNLFAIELHKKFLSGGGAVPNWRPIADGNLRRVRSDAYKKLDARPDLKNQARLDAPVGDGSAALGNVVPVADAPATLEEEIEAGEREENLNVGSPNTLGEVSSDYAAQTNEERGEPEQRGPAGVQAEQISRDLVDPEITEASKQAVANPSPAAEKKLRDLLVKKILAVAKVEDPESWAEWSEAPGEFTRDIIAWGREINETLPANRFFASKRSDAATPSAKPSPGFLQKITELMKRLAPNVRFRIVASNQVGAVPEGSQRLESLAAQGVEAYYDSATDEVVFIEDNISEDRASKLPYHELTHRNLFLMEQTLGGRLELAQILATARKELMVALPDLLAATGHTSIAELKQEYGFGDTRQGEAALLGELMCRYAERLADKPKPSWWKSLIAKVRVWLARNFNVNLSADALEYWLAGNFERFSQTPSGARSDQKAFSKRAKGATKKATKGAAATPPAATGAPDVAKRNQVLRVSKALKRVMKSLDPKAKAMLTSTMHIKGRTKEDLAEAHAFIFAHETLTDAILSLDARNPASVYQGLAEFDANRLSDEQAWLARGIIAGKLNKLASYLETTHDSIDKRIVRAYYKDIAVDQFRKVQEELSKAGSFLSRVGRSLADLYFPEAVVRDLVDPIRKAQAAALKGNADAQDMLDAMTGAAEPAAEAATDDVAPLLDKLVGPLPGDAKDLKKTFDVFEEMRKEEEAAAQEEEEAEADEEAQEEETAPTEEAPVEEEAAPTEEAPTEEAPAQEETPTAEDAPTEAPTQEETPTTEEAPAQETPAQETPAHGTPTQGTPAQGTPTQGTPTQGTPTQGTPTQGTPTQGTPTQGTPTQGTPTQGTPTQGTPAPEKTPKKKKEEALDEDKSAVQQVMDKIADQFVKLTKPRIESKKKPITPRLFELLTKQIRTEVTAQLKPLLGNKMGPKAGPVQKLLYEIDNADLVERAFNQSVQALLARGDLSADERERLQGARFRGTDLKAAQEVIRRGVRMREEVRKHMSQQGASLDSLTQAILDNAQVSEEKAAAVAEALRDAYNLEARKAVLANLEALKKVRVPSGPKLHLSERYLMLANLGAFDSAEVYNAIAAANPSLKLPVADAKLVAEIKKEADRIQTLPGDSDVRNAAMVALLGRVAKEHVKNLRGWGKAGYYIGDVAPAVWQAGVLSGPPTAIVNFLGTALNVQAQALFRAYGYRRAAIKAGASKADARKFYTDIATGWLDAVGLGREGDSTAMSDARQALTTGTTRYKNATRSELSVLENHESLKFLHRGVMRLMLAADGYNTATANEIKQRMALRYAMLTQGKQGAEVAQAMQEAFDPDTVVRASVEQQIAEETANGFLGTGKELEINKATRRNELFEKKRFEMFPEMRDIVREEAEKWTLNSDPKGLMGFVLDGALGQINRSTKVSKFFLSFLRTQANLLNLAFDFSPLGILHAYNMAPGNFLPEKNRYRLDPIDRSTAAGQAKHEALFAQGVAGTAMIFALGAMVMKGLEDELEGEEPWFAVYGAGPKTAMERQQLREGSDWEPNTLKLGDLKLRFTDFPIINLVLGAYGNLSDMVRFNKTTEDKDVVEWGMLWGLGMLNTVVERQMLSGMSNLFDVIKNPDDRGIQSLKRLTSGVVGGFTNPQALKWARNTLWMDSDGKAPVLDQRSTAGWVASMIPASVGYDKPSLNVLGEPIREYFWVPTSRRFFSLSEPPHPILEPIVGNGLRLKSPAKTSQVEVAGVMRPVGRSEEAWRRFVELRGEEIKRRTTPALLGRLPTMKRETAQTLLDKLTDQARDVASKRLAAEIKAGAVEF